MPVRLKPSFQAYAWGHRSFIQNFCGSQDELGRPLAEMWLGAHPQAPCYILNETGEIALHEFIARDPERHLGKAMGIYEGRLPFLMKVLAAEQPLSIQVHPDKQTAEQGFATENLKAIPLTSPVRNFRDDNHKPEMMLALTPFNMMRGFREYREIIHLFNFLGVDGIWTKFKEFSQVPVRQTLQALFAQILTSTESQLQRFVNSIKSSGSQTGERDTSIPEIVLFLNGLFPLDSGIVSPLLLNTFTLQPGQAVYLDSGIPHAYLKGAGIELMANSDNVIRAGLTQKHIDRDLLLQVTDWNASLPTVQNINLQAEKSTIPSPFREFQLSHFNLEGSQTYHPDNKPAILLCLSGCMKVDKCLKINKGQTLFISASETELSLAGQATLALATIPD